MAQVRFLDKKHLSKVSQKELESLLNSSKKFFENVENEYYNRQAREIERVKKELGKQYE